MDSFTDDGTLLPPGFPIQTSTDQSLLAAPRGFSQLTTSFFGVQCHGIHPAPFITWSSWLSSCQSFTLIAYPETNCKIVAFLRSYVLSNTFATGFFTRCFSIWLCSFQGTFRSLSIPENDTGSRRRTVNCQTLRLVFFSFTHLCVSTWDEAIWFLFSLSP